MSMVEGDALAQIVDTNETEILKDSMVIAHISGSETECRSFIMQGALEWSDYVISVFATDLRKENK
jgi:hypothetical protein